MKPETKVPNPVETLVSIDANELKTKQWNECISPRLAELRGWFSADSWGKGIRPYLNYVLGERREHMERLENDARADQFIKGQIAMLKQILGLPAAIDKQIDLLEKRNEQSPKGDAGY